MGTFNPKVDEKIEVAAPFAQEIMLHVRKLVHKACPDVSEEIKWNFPCFIYNGSILASMSAFKQHCSFGWFLSSKMTDPEGILQFGPDRDGMGSLGKLTDKKQLPSDKIIIAYTKEAMALIDAGVKMDRGNKEGGPTAMEVPSYFSKALKANAEANKHFKSFSIGKKNEYIQWLEESKTDATRAKRLDTAIEWISEGKSRLWKYQK
jgi:uncharacterized protein YdeI (YjbR/CyaY-like superfamily)